MKGYLSSGMTTCAGCAMELVARVVLESLGRNTVVVIPPGCAAILAGYSGETPLELPVVMSNLEATAAFASGIRAGLDVLGKEEVCVLGFAGDGGTADIGLQSLSGAAERNDRIVYVCYDNEAYMNTGIQGSGSTPGGAWTTTTPAGKGTPRKDLARILMAHRVPYVATASVAYPDDLSRKVKKAALQRGTSFIHVHSPCPTGWRFPPSKTIEVARLAVRTGLWVLYEAENGKVTVNVRPGDVPVTRYVEVQGRFRGLGPEGLASLQAEADENRRWAVSCAAGASSDAEHVPGAEPGR